MPKLTPERLAAILQENEGGQLNEAYVDLDEPGEARRDITIEGYFDVNQLVKDLELEMREIQPGDIVRNISHPELDWRECVRVVDDAAITIMLAGAESSPIPIDIFRVAIPKEERS